MTDNADCEGEAPQRHAMYCATCQMTVRVFLTDEGAVVGCHSGCHQLPIEAVANEDLPADWSLEESPFNW